MTSAVPSSQSVFCLINQSTLSNVLMESVLKLAALTQSNFFFLVETPLGRRFVGSPHLCQAFNHGEFSNSGHDLELALDCSPDFTTLKAKPLPPLPVPLRHQASANRSVHPSTPTGQKRASSFSAAVAENAAAPPSKIKRVSSSPQLALDEGGDAESLSDGAGVDCPTISDELDSDANITTELERIRNCRLAGKAAYEFDLTWIEKNFSRGNPMWEFIAGADKDTDFSQNNVALKILDSLLLDVGRHAASSFQRLGAPQLRRRFFDAVFIKWCFLFPNVKRLAKINVGQMDQTSLRFADHARAKMIKGFRMKIKK